MLCIRRKLDVTSKGTSAERLAHVMEAAVVEVARGHETTILPLSALVRCGTALRLTGAHEGAALLSARSNEALDGGHQLVDLLVAAVADAVADVVFEDSQRHLLERVRRGRHLR